MRFVRPLCKQVSTAPEPLKFQHFHPLSTWGPKIVYNPIHILMWNPWIAETIANTGVNGIREESYPKVIHISL